MYYLCMPQALIPDGDYIICDDVTYIEYGFVYAERGEIKYSYLFIYLVMIHFCLYSHMSHD